MFFVSGRCPICYAQWKNSEFCPACGCSAEIYYERELPSRERINIALVETVMRAARARLVQYADDPMPRYALGLSYTHLGLFAEGVNELNRVADLLPEKHQLRYEAAAISAKFGPSTDKALEQLNTVLARRPDFEQALYLRGVIHAKQGDMQAAVRDWQSAYRIDDHYQPARQQLSKFIAKMRPYLAVDKIAPSTLDATAQATLQQITARMPPAPLAMGRTSLDLLRLLSEKTARRMVQMHARVIREYDAAVRERKEAMQRLDNDVLALTNLCLAYLEAKQKIQSVNSLTPLTIQARTFILNQAIQGYQKDGYRLVSSTETTAQLYKPKEFSCCLAVIMVFLIIGIVLYLLYYLSKKDDSVYLEVDEYGRLRTTQS